MIGTRAGEVGAYIVVARRRGSEWWLGAITDARARTVSVPLDLLGKGVWTLDGYADEGETRRARHEARTIRHGDILVLRMGSAGGYAARLSPATS